MLKCLQKLKTQARTLLLTRIYRLISAKLNVMERWNGKVAIVTGACVGSGAAITKTLVEHGVKVVGFARRTERITDLAAALSKAPGKLYGVKCNITSEDSIQRSFKWVLENLGPVSILINNAGLTRSTNLTEGATEAWRKLFDINVIALCICTREAIRAMNDHKINGHIIHMNSILGHYLPFMNEPHLISASMHVYPASKFAVTALAESLRAELQQQASKIKVTSISPGFVSTPNEDLAEGGELVGRIGLRPEDVAEAVIYALSTGPNVQVQELMLQPLVSATIVPASPTPLPPN